MLRLVRITLVSLSALLLLAAACGGDDDSTGSATDAPTATEATATETDSGDDGGDGNGASADLDDYFTEVSKIALRTDTKLEQVGSDLQNATFADDAEEIATTQDAFQQVGETLELAILDFADLDPPPEAEDAHAEFIEKLQAALIVQSQFLADMEDLTTSAELDALAEEYNPDLAETDADFDEACLALQGIADGNGIDADLRCTG